VQAKDELAFVKLRYKLPGEGSSRLISQPIRASAVAAASQELRFAAAVAAFGQALRGGEHLAGFGLGDIEQLARGARGADPRGERAEFLRLVGLAQALAPADPRQAAR
jgi:Ca-activated chloride channel family protein